MRISNTSSILHNFLPDTAEYILTIQHHKITNDLPHPHFADAFHTTSGFKPTLPPFTLEALDPRRLSPSALHLLLRGVTIALLCIFLLLALYSRLPLAARLRRRVAGPGMRRRGKGKMVEGWEV